jgi:hypothetical protein
MARFDKYNPVSGGFRARLGWTPAGSDVGAIIPVVLNGSGVLVKAAANDAAAKGVVCLVFQNSLNDVVDVMTDGEIVDIDSSDIVDAVAGGTVKVGAAGTVSVAGTGRNVGWMVEAWRLIVRMGRGA